MFKIPLSNGDIKEHAPARSGVYFLFDSNEHLTYIGKSNNIQRRLLEHFRGYSHLEEEQHFFNFSLCSENVLDEIESLMITNIQPKTNQKKKSKLTSLAGVYFEPNVLEVLKTLSAQGGKGTQSRIVNDGLKETFIRAGFMDVDGNIIETNFEEERVD